LADCYCTQNAVHDEWLVRDQAAIVLQMGEEVEDWTRRQIAREGGPEACVQPFTPLHDVAGPYTGDGNADETGARLAELITRMMAADFAAVPAGYDYWRASPCDGDHPCRVWTKRVAARMDPY